MTFKKTKGSLRTSGNDETCRSGATHLVIKSGRWKRKSRRVHSWYMGRQTSCLVPGPLCQRWEFPTVIEGLIGSCVEIPCIYYPPRNSRTSSTVCRGSSSVERNYKDRTSLVHGSNGCSLRIDPVREDDDEKRYFPGVAEETNAWTQSRRSVQLHTTDAPKNVTVSLSENKSFPEGNNVILTCSSRSNPPPLRYEWFYGKSKMKLEHQSQKITVQNVSKDTGSYSCAARNDVGRGESPPEEIPVLYAPTGVQVIVLHSTEGATELKCSFARSNPDVTRYTWMKEGNRIMNTTGPILVLDGKEDEFGSYACIAHNAAGSSASAELDFKGRQ
ncbi:B-cell receptor CD22-like [Mantella aurantiaca]